MDNIGFSEIYKNKRILKKQITVDSKKRNKENMKDEMQDMVEEIREVRDFKTINITCINSAGNFTTTY